MAYLRGSQVFLLGTVLFLWIPVCLQIFCLDLQHELGSPLQGFWNYLRPGLAESVIRLVHWTKLRASLRLYNVVFFKRAIIHVPTKIKYIVVILCWIAQLVGHQCVIISVRGSNPASVNCCLSTPKLSWNLPSQFHLHVYFLINKIL